MFARIRPAEVHNLASRKPLTHRCKLMYYRILRQFTASSHFLHFSLFLGQWVDRILLHWHVMHARSVTVQVRCDGCSIERVDSR